MKKHILITTVWGRTVAPVTEKTRHVPILQCSRPQKCIALTVTATSMDRTALKRTNNATKARVCVVKSRNAASAVKSTK